jgi:hypothetical protein
MSRGDEQTIVDAWMKTLAAAPIDAGPIADPSFLWWKAQLLRRWDAEREAAKPIELGERVQIVVALFGVFVLFGGLWRFLPATGGATIATMLVMMLIVATVAAVGAWTSFPRG